MLPILMYHGLHATPQSAGRFDAVYSVGPEDFGRQLDWLRDNGYQSMLLDEACGNGVARQPKQVVITFDDGDTSNLEIALPLLQERGMRAEFFVTTDFIDQPGMLSSAGVKALADAGMGLGSHGRTHAFLEDLAESRMFSELRDSRHRLEAICGRSVSALALPGGRGGERERRAAQALGYRHLLGSVPGINRQARMDGWLQRIAITRDLGVAEFAARVRWRGVAPRLLQVRHQALKLPKRMLGNAGYERLRERLL